ncbi:hypothetical protein D3C83_222660 [compost metagenome]
MDRLLGVVLVQHGERVAVHRGDRTLDRALVAIGGVSRQRRQEGHECGDQQQVFPRLLCVHVDVHWMK